ncbi:endonuclease domain-containing protein [Pseudoxanthomonas sp. PXM02]|uniref:endonuclease domain-containing protein n=1 Tax=Pseudoxanthomonas sp. PXM02 TaxID=2769294 RepID=UPI0017818831|nr:endonuclease domain-containing protein [Pseudoxanthomonas sp. PXM02]MBD9478595.1 endonuclease domain-containing protein [Pseudoxanthomonas sp. PXM02]
MRQGQKRDRARELRRNMTLAERKLWSFLKDRQLEGFRFRRQHPIGPYIADFVCLEAGLIVEVDGGQHMDAKIDGPRDAFLRGKGFRILRFWNNEVMVNLEGVRALILSELGHLPPSQPSPAHGGRGRS